MRKGFSLIELMVVISIIGILTAIGAVSFTTAQQKSRDAARKSDMRAVQNALEQYFTVNASEYPTAAADCQAGGLSDIFPGGLPEDPKGDQSYTYVCDADSYCVCAEMESDEGNYYSGACATSGTTKSYFCVVNQQ